MPTKLHYHIHICLVRNEHPEFENALQLALSDDYFLTWDLIAHPSNFMEYSRHQIERCDYVLFVLGNGYGHLSPSGVSFLHLSYIYAVTKRKPLLALIKTPTGQLNFSRQRLDLASLISKDGNTEVVFFDRTQTAIAQGVSALNALVERTPRAGWQRETPTSDTLLKSPHSLNHPNVLLPKVTAKDDTDSAKSSLKDPAPNVPIKEAVKIKEVVKSAESAVFSPVDTVGTNTTTEQPVLPVLSELEQQTLDDEIQVSYSAHAYQGGNLQTVTATHRFTWRQIVELLKTLPKPFSSDSIFRCLNDSLKQFALIEASRILPNVHAVSRCQINTVDFQWIKKQLHNHQWMLKESGSRTGRELWFINPSL